MNREQKAVFERDMGIVWDGLKAAIHPEYHPRLRKVFMRIIKKDEKEFQEFVELMETEKEDVANRRLQEAAEEQQEAEAENDEVLHQCHYCGDMYHVSDLSGAKEGLICYKCRHEMENRE